MLLPNPTQGMGRAKKTATSRRPGKSSAPWNRKPPPSRSSALSAKPEDQQQQAINASKAAKTIAGATAQALATVGVRLRRRALAMR